MFTERAGTIDKRAEEDDEDQQRRLWQFGEMFEHGDDDLLRR